MLSKIWGIGLEIAIFDSSNGIVDYNKVVDSDYINGKIRFWGTFCETFQQKENGNVFQKSH